MTDGRYEESNYASFAQFTMRTTFACAATLDACRGTTLWRYLVDILVQSEGMKKQERFRIENDHTIDEFRLASL